MTAQGRWLTVRAAVVGQTKDTKMMILEKGANFIWENARTMHHGYIIEGDGSPQVTTNFLLHRHPDLNDLPDAFDRFRKIRKGLADWTGKFSLDFIKETSRCVSFQSGTPAPPPCAPNRTIWHALYYPEERRLEIDFYLGEEPDSQAPDGMKIRRSGYQRFSMKR